MSTLRTASGSEDLDRVFDFQLAIYARDFGFDESFREHVSVPLRAFGASSSPRQRLWLAEEKGQLAGCIAIVEASEKEAQLRWFLVDPAFRGQGLGTQLLQEAILFARACRYESILLWTVDRMQSAARLYRAHGFEKVEEHPGTFWGVEMAEEKYWREL